MRVHILQHVAFEGPGAMDDWLVMRGAEVSVTAFYEPAYRVGAGGLGLSSCRARDWLVSNPGEPRAG